MTGYLSPVLQITNWTPKPTVPKPRVCKYIYIPQCVLLVLAHKRVLFHINITQNFQLII